MSDMLQRAKVCQPRVARQLSLRGPDKTVNHGRTGKKGKQGKQEEKEKELLQALPTPQFSPPLPSV